LVASAPDITRVFAMSRFKRCGRWLVTIGGILGVALCFAAIVAVWLFAARLREINELAHDGLVRSAQRAREQVLRAQQSVVESRIDSEDLRQRLASWSTETAARHAAAKLDIQTKAERLSTGLETIDQYLELGQSLADSIHDTIELAGLLGIREDDSPQTALRERFEATRTRLHEATTTLVEIRRRVDDVADAGQMSERRQQAIQLSLRVIATVGNLDEHLADAANRIDEAQSWASDSKTKVRNWTIAGQIVASAILAWLGLGQASLCRQAYRASQRTSG
jgi:hypothetical protein